MTFIEPQNIPRDEFPKSGKSSNGMKILSNTCDNHCMHYVHNIEYIKREDKNLTIQLLLPDDISDKTPLVVYVTGSAFHWQDVYGTIPHLSLLVNRGVAIASVQYRGSDMAPFPAQMMDVKAAVRFMKINARKYNLNPDNIFLMGDSSGGHTALMAGLTAGLSEYEEDIYTEVDSKVNGIIDMYGPTDISKMNEELSSQNHTTADSPEGFLIGRKNVLENPELYEPTIVMNYISKGKDMPPILMFHGTNDELVPFGQSCMLYDKLMECDKKADFYAIDGAHHGGREFWSEQCLDIIIDFIENC